MILESFTSSLDWLFFSPLSLFRHWLPEPCLSTSLQGAGEDVKALRFETKILGEQGWSNGNMPSCQITRFSAQQWPRAHW